MAALEPVVLDFETFWDTNHSLTKMSPIEYVMHPETEIISCAAKTGGRHTCIAFGEKDVGENLRNFPWHNKLVVAHNMSGFDAMILAWRFGVRPAMWGCTLAMARPIHAKDVGLSLGALVEHYGLGVKDQTILHNTKGKHLKDFTQDELDKMAVYNKADVDQCWDLFKVLAKQTSKDEMRLIDMTIRMLVEPQFEVDVPLLQRTLAAEKARKVTTLLNLGTMLGLHTEGMNESETIEAVRETLGSAAKFGKLLTALGVEVPTKISKTTKKPTPALAKTDQAFIALTESDDPIVAAAAQARLGVKSTLLESRIEAFVTAAENAGGRLPIPLKYYGADTTGRWSGWGYNPQNLSRVDPKNPRPSDALRLSLRAPAGKKVVVADLSGIELRVNMFLWKVPYAMELFQADPEKADLYRYFAAHELYHVEEDEVAKAQRQVGKVSHLGLGFGSGAKTFKGVAKIMGGVTLTDDESFDIVDTYRTAHPEIVAGWKRCHKALSWIRDGLSMPIDPWEMCWTCSEGIRTPKGLIRYPDLRQEEVDTGEVDGNGEPITKVEWFYGTGRNKARIYGPKVVENIVQHLARSVIAGNALSFAKTDLGKQYPLAHTVHDELIYLPDASVAEQLLTELQREMRTPPQWWPELVVWSEGGISETYGHAK